MTLELHVYSTQQQLGPAGRRRAPLNALARTYWSICYKIQLWLGGRKGGWCKQVYTVQIHLILAADYSY